MRSAGNPAMTNIWRLLDEERVESPSLIYYPDIITRNTQKAVAIAKSADRLWPHVKTYKMAEVVRLLRGFGINRFKCATVGEAEMLAGLGVPHILLSYPLVGPNIERFMRLRTQFGDSSAFWAVCDDLRQLALLGEAALAAGGAVNVLADVNTGTDRTGVLPAELADFCLRCGGLPGISLQGLHSYDGNLAVSQPEERLRLVKEKLGEVLAAKASAEKRGQPLPTLVMGGSPTFPLHAALHDFYLSPGTLFIHDHGYKSKFPDLDFTPGAALLTRVVSRPSEKLFTIDLGYKAISTDQKGAPGVIVGLPQAEPVSHSEEHWVFRMEDGDVPQIGDVLYVLPTHICSTTALYPYARAAKGGRVTDCWEVTARDRKIEI